ncbi:hypothetical protein D9758_005558 [Tetrapyrgos nigripes]|uniref:F-box domain-containing protein n=1 Tax=Tetrapyrgos nigripes TaxID=182062 RepID=A0A8H5LPE2_9AGAR|nr:hypothetical protein D9758_005558 [Tetrapyrgos nigripes]
MPESPVYRLPTEILSDVLLWTLPLSSSVLEESIDEADIPTFSAALSYPSFRVFDITKGPWPFTHVCKRWRETSISLPLLWCSFYVGTPPEGAVHLLSTCLSRSASLPLIFTVKADDICDYGDSQGILGLLNSESDRWFAIQIINSSFSFWRDLAGPGSGVIGPLSFLKEIGFVSTTPNNFDNHDTLEITMPRLFDMFARGRTPKLDSVINYDSYNLSSFNLRWSQIVTYDGAHLVAPHEHFRVMRLAPSLTRCSLVFETEEYDIRVPHGKPLTLSHLRILRTEWFFYSEDHICPALLDLTLPALRELSIVARPHSSPPFGTFASILRASGCPLQYLELSGVVSGDPIKVIRSLLEAASTISHLRIWINTPIRETVLPLLNVQKFGPLVPRLRCLDLAQEEARDVWSLNMPVLADTVRTRLESRRPEGYEDDVVTLHTVRFALNTKDRIRLPAGIPPILEVLQGEGLNVAVCRTSDEWRSSSPALF